MYHANGVHQVMVDENDIFANYNDDGYGAVYIGDLKCWVVNTVKFQEYLNEHYSGKYHLLYLDRSFHVVKPAFGISHIKRKIKEQIWADLVYGRPDYKKGLKPFTNDQASYYIRKWRSRIRELARIYMRDEATLPEDDHIRELMYDNKFNPVKKTRKVEGLSGVPKVNPYSTR